MGKVVKSFNKSEDKDIKKIASDLMDNWMKLVSAGGGPKKKKGPDDGISKKEQLGPRKGSSKSVHMGKPLDNWSHLYIKFLLNYFKLIYIW